MGITENKEEKIKNMEQEVFNCRHEVEECQAIVNSLTEKSTMLASKHDQTQQEKGQTLTNKQMGEQILDEAESLYQRSLITKKQMSIAETSISKTTELLSTLIKQVIYSAELVNMLSELIMKKKASNPLISDDLVRAAVEAGTNANRAVSMTLDAMRSTFTSSSTSLESLSILELENYQAKDLLDQISMGDPDFSPDSQSSMTNNSLMEHVSVAYQTALNSFNRIQLALTQTNDQLNRAQHTLNEKQVELSSLEAGLAAAKTAIES